MAMTLLSYPIVLASRHCRYEGHLGPPNLVIAYSSVVSQTTPPVSAAYTSIPDTAKETPNSFSNDGSDGNKALGTAAQI